MDLVTRLYIGKVAFDVLLLSFTKSAFYAYLRSRLVKSSCFRRTGLGFARLYDHGSLLSDVINLSI